MGIVTSLLALAVLGSPDDPLLKEAREKLEAREEPTVKEGAEMCARMNSIESVELLLRVLNNDDEPNGYLAPGHYRDVCWASLEKITDPYARRRVEAELKKSKRPLVRQWCAQLLGIYGDSTFGDTLVRALDDKEEGVQRWAAWSLGRMSYPSATKALLRFIKDKNIYFRANAVEALARQDKEQFKKDFLNALQKDADGGVRCALLGAAAQIYEDDAETLSIPFIKDADWRPRMQAVDNLGVIETKTSVDNLIDAVNDGRAAVANRAMKYLHKLTAKPFRDYASWKQWWGSARETFQFVEGGKPQTGQTVVTYNRIVLDSDHVGFLIDRSKKMEEMLKTESSSKEEAAIAELEKSLNQLIGKISFRLFGYAEDIVPMDKKALKVDKANIKAAIAFLRGGKLGQRKNIWNALDHLMEDPSIDTAFLLASGEPDFGIYVHWNRICNQLADLNRFHKKVIHGVAYSDNKWYRDQIENIAKCTGGEFQFFE